MPTTKDQTYIVSDYLIKNKPRKVILYKGKVEIDSILTFKHFLYKQYYEGLERNLHDLNFKGRDLRKDFRPTNQITNVVEIIDRNRDRKSIKLSELWEIFYKDSIQGILKAVLNRMGKQLSRRVNKAFREKDKAFLKEFGY